MDEEVIDGDPKGVPLSFRKVEKQLARIRRKFDLSTPDEQKRKPIRSLESDASSGPTPEVALLDLSQMQPEPIRSWRLPREKNCGHSRPVRRDIRSECPLRVQTRH